MTEWVQGNDATRQRAPRAISAAPCGSAPIPRCSKPRQPASPAFMARRHISERHRHRYEVNIAYRGRLEQHGMRFSGMSPDGLLPEIIEYPDHPWFIGVQFHPELKSRPFAPHPLFAVLHRGRGGAEPAGVAATPNSFPADAEPLQFRPPIGDIVCEPLAQAFTITRALQAAGGEPRLDGGARQHIQDRSFERCPQGRGQARWSQNSVPVLQDHAGKAEFRGGREVRQQGRAFSGEQRERAHRVGGDLWQQRGRIADDQIEVAAQEIVQRRSGTAIRYVGGLYPPSR